MIPVVFLDNDPCVVARPRGHKRWLAHSCIAKYLALIFVFNLHVDIEQPFNAYAAGVPIKSRQLAFPSSQIFIISVC